jgi:hypothetical protein
MWQANQDARDAIKEAVKGSATEEQKAQMKENMKAKREKMKEANENQKEKMKEAAEKVKERKQQHTPNK